MFMTFALSWAQSIRADNAIYTAGGSGTLGLIDPWDVAAVACKALTAPKHESAAPRADRPRIVEL
jgi:hypothetical protein